jgi:hypothetical protein
MFSILFVYIIGPFLVASLLIKALKKYSKNELDPEIRAIYLRHPLEKGFFRVVKSDHKGKALVGDFEEKMDAVDCAYREKENAQAAAQNAAFLVLNHKGETLEETDA